MPRTFQARLTIGFVSVVALTLLLVSAFVINRLDDSFLQQQAADLDDRTETVAAVVVALARDSARIRPVVTRSGILDPEVQAVLGDQDQIQLLSNRLAQADIRIRFGLGTVTDFEPATNGEFNATYQAQPRPDQHPEPTAYTRRFEVENGLFTYVLEVTLSGPYTFRAAAIANVTGLLAAIGLFALGLSMIVASVLARRYTTPLRGLTEASRTLAEGDLSGRVPESLIRTGSVEVAELSQQFNRMAERLQESVEIIRNDRDRSRDFLADVSHELRTPIAALRMFNELLQEHGEQDPEARREFLQSTAQQLDRLDWLAQNLLELSKLDSGLVLLDLRPDDLRAAVESSVDQARPAADRRGVALHIELPDRPLRIRHDPQRVGQVVANLLGNAIKFTEAGGTVTVEAAAHPDGALIEVRDTGVGIEPDELPRIFERFYRGARVNEARGSGSGLGLAIVRSIVDMHGGTVTVESRPGAGSRFTVFLPRDPQGAEDATRAPLGSDAAAAPVPRHDPELALNMADSSSTEGSRLNTGTSP
ncbi:MAG TPA: HAMP domain-containing sensor histidine kinase [Candidatus Limnocylindrales bacterium]